MHRIVALALLLTVLGLVLPGKASAEAPAQALPQTIYTAFLPMISDGSGAAQSHDSTVVEAQVLVAINNLRQAQGCQALTVASELNTAAQQHSSDMAYNDFYAHSGSDGSDSADRAEQAGYNWLSVAEIIAAGPEKVDDVMQMWMSSSNHRADILDCGMHEVGVGYVYLATDPGQVTAHNYWTVLFGTR